MPITETIPFNFDENYEFIENKFKEKGYDLEEGSNTMQLVAAMSYLTSMLNANTAVNVNETILPLARKRKNIIQDSRVMGYELDHVRSYRYNLGIRLTNTTETDQLRSIIRHTSFSANGLTYYYMGNGFEVTVPANGFKDITIKVTEGVLLKYTDPGQDPLNVHIRGVRDDSGTVVRSQEYIDIPYTDVEENGIEAFLTYHDEFGVYHKHEEWSRSDSFMIDGDTSLNKEFVRLDDINYGTPRIYFKIGDVGKNLRVGAIVKMNVLRSNGSSGKMTELPDPVALDDAEVLWYTLNLAGSDEESNDSIKENAPLFHNTANRVITKNDYIAFCNRMSKVKCTQVWDGHDEAPNIPGHIWFSFVPGNTVRSIVPTDSTKTVYQMQDLSNPNNWYIDRNDSVSNVQEIYDMLDKYKIPTLIFHHRNPMYMDFDYDINIVKYGLSKTRADRNETVFEVINEYFSGRNTEDVRTIETPVESYQFEYFQSNLTKRIDSELTDITGFNINLRTTIQLNKDIVIDREKVASYDEYGNPFSYYKEMIFHLGFPYEDILNMENEVVESNFPSIKTENFIGASNLYVDLSTKYSDSFDSVVIYDIRLGGGSTEAPDINDQKIGKYKVHVGVVKTIEVVIFIVTDSGHRNGILETDLDTTRTVEIKYPSPNLRFSRNTIPRLRQVNFV